MNKIVRIMALVFTIWYVVSPADAFPGPIDDMILIMLCYMSNRVAKQK